MTTRRFIPPLCPDADTYAFLVQRHKSEAEPTGGWSIPDVCSKALEEHNNRTKYSISEVKQALANDNSPCDDITNHWAQLMCLDDCLKEHADNERCETVRQTWPTYNNVWDFLVDYWVAPNSTNKPNETINQPKPKKTRAEVLKEQINLAVKAQNHDKADDYLKELVQIYDDMITTLRLEAAAALAQRGEIAFRRSAYREAREHFAEAVRFTPRDHFRRNEYDNLGYNAYCRMHNARRNRF